MISEFIAGATLGDSTALIILIPMSSASQRCHTAKHFFKGEFTWLNATEICNVIKCEVQNGLERFP